MRYRSLFGLFLSLFLIYYVIADRDDQSDEDTDGEEEELSPGEKEYYNYLAKRLKESADSKKSEKNRAIPTIYEIPGPFEPLPGRSHNGDYWPVFPFQNQYSGGVDLDPSISRHIGGDINVPVPSWGMMDITGHFFNRISDTTTKFGYINHPVNMLGLNKDDFATLISDPRTQANRYIQPNLPLGKLPRAHVPLSCKPPMCNPYQGTFGFGLDHDIGGHDGNEGDINIPFPVSKGVAYRFPFGGNYYYDLDNITVSYGHNIAPLDPYANPYFFNNQYTRQRQLLPPEPDVFPRQKRQIIGYMPVVLREVPSEGRSDSTKVTSNDFKHVLHAPERKTESLGSLRRIMKRDTGVEIKKVTPSTPTREQIDKSESLYGKLETLFKSGHHPSGDENDSFDDSATEKTMKISVEKVIIPADMFMNQYAGIPTPRNQGYFDPYHHQQDDFFQYQPMFANVDPEVQYYDPSIPYNAYFQP